MQNEDQQWFMSLLPQHGDAQMNSVLQTTQACRPCSNPFQIIRHLRFRWQRDLIKLVHILHVQRLRAHCLCAGSSRGRRLHRIGWGNSISILFRRVLIPLWRRNYEPLHVYQSVGPHENASVPTGGFSWYFLFGNCAEFAGTWHEE